MTLADDAADIEQVHEAEREREQAYDAEYQWRGTPLQPFTIGREAIYLSLRAMNTSVPLHIARLNPSAFLVDALILLFLCAHRPEEWAPVRADIPQFLAAVDEWADENVPHTMATEAIDLALKILNDASKTKAMPKPSGREDQTGN